MRLMATGDDVTGPINLGNAGEFTMRQLAEMVIELTGSKSKFELRPLPQDDPKKRQPNITIAQEILGWAPVTPLREGLVKTIAYFDDMLRAMPAPPITAQ